MITEKQKALYGSLVLHLGGVKKTADKFNCAQPTVTGWKQGKHGMSAKHAIIAEKITSGEYKKEELCPDLEGLF